MASSKSTEEVTKSKKKPEDFIFGKIIGEGSFSTVYLAKEISSGNEFAVKVLTKSYMIKENKAQYVMREKKVFEMLAKKESPFFVRLYATFQDSTKLFFVLSYEPNGELLDYIRKLSAFDMKSTKFYSAEIVSALEHLHSIGIVHRDLKPENILLSKDMHVRITDFGSARLLGDDTTANPKNLMDDNGEDVRDSPDGDRPAPRAGRPRNRHSSFVGTAQYVSPEVLQSKTVTISCDLWAFGCILYQLISGEHPFRGNNEYQIFQRIIKLDYDFPEGFDSKAKHLVAKLLILDSGQRLGTEATGGYDALKSHSFFEATDWNHLHEQQAPKLMPYLPALNNHSEDLWSDMETAQGGLNDEQICKLIGLGLGRSKENEEEPAQFETEYPELLYQNAEKDKLLQKQALENDFHKFVEGNVILYQGLLDKRKGLFARRRMFLMTEGPHLYYVDPVNQVLKGEIPWSRQVRPESKNFKIFFVHTPNRTYYLEDPAGYGQVWCQKIEALWRHYYGPVNPKHKR